MLCAWLWEGRAARAEAGIGRVVAAALVAALLLAALLAAPARAEDLAKVRALGADEARHVDRYRVTIGPGATLWDIAQTYLPLIALDQGDQQAYQLVLAGFQQQFPGRSPAALQPGDEFSLEVPSGTFVTQTITRDQHAIVYRSFLGDELTYYPRDPALLYRLIRHDAPGKAEVRLSAQEGSPVDFARAIYEVDAPDFIQVRTVRAALQDRNQRVLVDLEHKYLDEFRNYRDRAKQVRNGEEGRKVYLFDPGDLDVPFVQVEDGIGDENDPANFPHLLRVAWYRNGIVERYVLTEPGDTVSEWTAPDAEVWKQVLPSVKGWKEGKVQSLPPFPSPLTDDGQLIPGRIMVIRFAPEGEPSAGVAGIRTTRRPAGASSGLSCAATPGLVILAGLALTLRSRRCGE